MTRRGILALVVLTVVAACGADGEPVQPTMNVGIGVSGNGVNTFGGVGLHRGPVSLFFGF